MDAKENQNSIAKLSWEDAEKLIGKKVKIQFESLRKERIGYLIDVYNQNDPFVVIEIGHGKYEDRKLSMVKSYKVVS